MGQYWLELAALAGIWALMVMLPGPNFLLVSRSSLDKRFSRGLEASLGVSIGAALWSSASMLGLAYVFREYQWLYNGFKLVGGCYIMWLGVLALRSGLRPNRPGPAPSVADCPGRRQVLSGLLTSLSNPKTAAFFACMFASLLSPSAPAWVPAVAVGLVFFVSLAWYALLAYAFSRSFVRRLYALARRPLDVVVGCVFMAMGGKLVTSE